MGATAESRTREALEWALDHTCLAIPPGLRTAAGWRWNADDAQLWAMTVDGDFRFHVAAERRRKIKVRIAILSWEDDMGEATWEAEMPNEGRFTEDGSYVPGPSALQPPQQPDDDAHPEEAGPEQPG